jgi:hypothetical protein
VFVDGCVQIWPDADLANAHRHGCDVFAVTALRPHTASRRARAIMDWHRLVARAPNLRLALTVRDVREAKAEGRPRCCWPRKTASSSTTTSAASRPSTRSACGC